MPEAFVLPLTAQQDSVAFYIPLPNNKTLRYRRVFDLPGTAFNVCLPAMDELTRRVPSHRWLDALLRTDAEMASQWEMIATPPEVTWLQRSRSKAPDAPVAASGNTTTG